MNKDNLITEPSNPEEMINSCYGRIDYRTWCEKELERMNDPTAKLITLDNGFIALTR